MAKLTKSFKSDSHKVVNAQGFRSVLPARARLSSVIADAGAKAISVEFPFGPQNVQYQTLEGKTVAIERPGKKPILFHQNQQLRTVTFNALLADKASGGVKSITDIMEDLEKLAATSALCTFVYGLTSLNFNVVITKLSFDVTYRNNAGEAVRANASIQLTESPVFVQQVVELKAVVKTVPPEPTYTKPGNTKTNNNDDDKGAEATSNRTDGIALPSSSRAAEQQSISRARTLALANKEREDWLRRINKRG